MQTTARDEVERIAAEKAEAERKAKEEAERKKQEVAEAEARRQQEQSQIQPFAPLPPAPAPEPVAVYYENCTAARAAGAAPVYVGEPGYAPHLDRDGDGIGCE